jgi:hypothetical protein
MNKPKWGRAMRYLPVVLLCLTGLAQAGIYKTYDKNGNVVFTDTPSNDAQEVADKPVATIPALPRNVIEQKTKPIAKDGKAAEPTAYKITIDNLKANTTFHREDKVVTANIQVEPPLWKYHHLQVTLDGKSLAQDNFAPEFDPSTAERGQHRLDVKVVNQKGAILSTEVVDFFVQLPSVAVKKK